MDPLTINSSSPSVLLARSSDDGERWFNVDSRFIIATIMLFGIVIVTVIRFGHEVFDPLAESLSIQGWAAVIARPSLLWFTMGMLLLAVRTLLWLRYHPVAPVEYEQAPRLSVVIPAYNEGAMVRQAVDACARAEYPRDRLDIIVVDDGSTDDTWMHVRLAAQQHRDLVRVVRLPVNQGKRAALAAGFENAAGDIIVTVDSDSLVERGALLAIAGPFRDERVGVVAGKVCVLNRFRGLLPRMLHVRFVLSFDFLRSAQSSYGTVYCCPGALSGYRASVISRWSLHGSGSAFSVKPAPSERIGPSRTMSWPPATSLCTNVLPSCIHWLRNATGPSATCFCAGSEVISGKKSGCGRLCGRFRFRRWC